MCPKWGRWWTAKPGLDPSTVWLLPIIQWHRWCGHKSKYSSWKKKINSWSFSWDSQKMVSVCVLGNAALGFHFRGLLQVGIIMRYLRKSLFLLPPDISAHFQDKGPEFGQQEQWKIFVILSCQKPIQWYGWCLQYFLIFLLVEKASTHMTPLNWRWVAEQLGGNQAKSKYFIWWHRLVYYLCPSPLNKTR